MTARAWSGPGVVRPGAHDDAIEEERPDVIVVNMTGPDGDVLGRGLLRRTEFHKQVSLVAVVDADRVGRLDLSLGLDDFASAPLRADELLARVRHALWRTASVDAENTLRVRDLVIDLANYKVFVNGELVTPSPSENILLGITRDTVIELARRELGIITRERQIDRTELYSADEILLCGTGAQIAPVIEVDHRPIGSGKIGPVGSQLQKIYFDVVRGNKPEYRQQWCTPAFVKQQSANPAD